VRAANLPSDLRIRLTCHSVSQFLDRHAADVSRGGIFVRNAQVLPVGRTVRLNLQLSNGSTLLAGEGTVFWTREADPARAESEPGMGIRFTRLTAESQQMLTHLLNEKAERERQDESSSFDEDERTVVATEEEMRAAAESHDESVISIGTGALAKVMALPPVRQAPVQLAVVARSLAAAGGRPLAMLETTAPPPAPVRAAPLPAAVAVAAAPAAPAPIQIARAAAQVAPAPAHPAPAATPAAFAATLPALLPVPEAASAAWEDDDDSLGSVSLSPPSDADEQTDLVPRGRRSIGIGVAIGVIAALAACLVLLNKPAATRLLASPTAITAPVATAAPAAAPAPFPVPAVITETAASTTRPLAPPAP
jgi:uncharacterized protein (TIGR02266 family)